MRPDGSGLSRVIASGGEPSWSPDGSKIAFLCNRDGDGQVCVKDLKSGQETQLTEFSYSANGWRSPRGPLQWSPDGSKIMFTRFYFESSGGHVIDYIDLWVVDSDGSKNAEPFVGQDGSYAIITEFAWSPDGSKIAAVHTDDVEDWCCFDVWIFYLDGTDPPSRNLTSDRDQGYASLDWSPNSKKLVWTRAGDILKMTPTGEQVQLTATIAREGGPVWSPGGRKIVFERECDLFKMRAHGTGVVNLTDTSDVCEGSPSWQAKPASTG